MAVLEADDDVVDMGWRFDADFDNALALGTGNGVEHPAEVEHGYRVLVEDAGLGCRSTGFSHWDSPDRELAYRNIRCVPDVEGEDHRF